jgi:MurNAc alpha-1-phosphate uridylyltransferase
MISVVDRALVDHALEQMQGISRQFANVHYCPDALTEKLNLLGLETVFEEDLLETGGGLKSILPKIDRDCVFTMNTDAVWKGPLAASFLQQHWDPERMDGLLLTVPQSQAHAHKGSGDFYADGEGRLSRGAGDVYTGLQIIKTSCVASVPQHAFSMNIVWEALLERNTLHGVNYPGEWCDVGYPEAIPIAEQLLET